MVTPENFNDDIGVVRAIFPGGQVCELEGVGKTRKFYNYTLNVRVRGGVYQEKRGFCAPSQIPSYDGGEIVIEFDEDDDQGLTTPNTVIAKIFS